MTKLQSLITEVLEKSKSPNYRPLKHEIGHDVLGNPFDILSDRNGLAFASGNIYRPGSDEIDYIVTAANNCDKLAKIVQVLSEALEYISKNEGHEPVCTKEEQCWEGCDGRRAAIEALKKSEEIANE